MNDTAKLSVTEDEGRVRLVTKETVWKRFVHLQTLVFDQTMADGRVVRLNREVHDHGSAAAILLFDADKDSVVLVRQFRPGAFVNGDPSFMLEVPAGLTDGDHPDEAIRREAMEETGYAVQEVQYLFDIYASPGTLTEKIGLFYARIDLDEKAGEGGGLETEGEDIEVISVPLDKAFSMIATGEITDAKTIILLQWAMLNREQL
ncbi:NUDIX domain-containing protein [Agrobacterium rubi]|uniref:NUDIX domain-containing protein n=1 Tax=Agrobacterium rubi TaxID=28099 RepID=UPI001573277D|nr:NUDIX domain-containing protein [Agrobacterium rubi]NTF07077.1 NUDIX domain-containing protein [Agrobacterium rubi]NTF19318.1 NUDIX domain-containing protein [Agrobacterium rubi]NTF26281.1 NUDIX domain-containing protein [Agrobacterium rubi]